MRTELNFEKGIELKTNLPQGGPLYVDFFIQHTLDLPDDARNLARYMRLCAAHLDSIAEIMKKKGGQQ
ncbi:hypothetical protein [Akkermansia massiliensis]|jgi:hypothetical protein|uniref:hypothetical protein n=1 Tax=Akkermansia massiliensis TaxID=2927224 RepID=UPI00202E8C69|nr:hypothetical protein [Akkermansia sp. B2-R-115]MCM0686183.1 hypothetical protein [Akkermansia sp. B2-R-115]